MHADEQSGSDRPISATKMTAATKSKPFRHISALTNRIHAPVVALHSQLLGDSFDSLTGLLGGPVDIRLKVISCAGCSKRIATSVDRAPESRTFFPLVVASMGRIICLDMPSATSMPRGARIFSGATEVSDRLVALVGHNDARQIPGARLARQQQAPSRRSVLMRFFRWLSRNPGGRDDIARPACFAQIAHPSRSRKGRPRTRSTLLSLVHTRRIALHSSAGHGLIVPINRGAARSASAIAIAMDSYEYPIQCRKW